MQSDDVDDLLAEAGRKGPQPSADLLARVLGDALDLQPAAAGRVALARPVAVPGFWAGLWAQIGGGPGLAGLSTAALAGLWLGFAQPAALSDMTETLWSVQAADDVELIAPEDDFFAEG